MTLLFCPPLYTLHKADNRAESWLRFKLSHSSKHVNMIRDWRWPIAQYHTSRHRRPSYYAVCRCKGAALVKSASWHNAI
eukprot:1158342-Pelagomonas_calceolata.AAC.4